MKQPAALFSIDIKPGRVNTHIKNIDCLELRELHCFHLLASINTLLNRDTLANIKRLFRQDPLSYFPRNDLSKSRTHNRSLQNVANTLVEKVANTKRPLCNVLRYFRTFTVRVI